MGLLQHHGIVDGYGYTGHWTLATGARPPGRQPINYEHYQLPIIDGQLAGPEELTQLTQATGYWYRRGEVFTLTAPSTVVATPLSRQLGDARVLFRGSMLGPTLITLHRSGDPSAPQQYLTLYGHMEELEPTLQRGDLLKTDTPVGHASSHFYLEVSRLGEGIEAASLTPQQLEDGELAAPVSLRTVLSPQ